MTAQKIAAFLDF